MKPSGIGGMAVMEGVMIKNNDAYAVAIRKPNNEIVVETNTYDDFSNKVKLFKLPIFRGMLAFVDSLVMGIKVLNFSTSFIEEEEEQKRAEKKKEKLEKKNNQTKKRGTRNQGVYINTNVNQKGSWVAGNENAKEKTKTNPVLMTIVVILSTIISVGLFMVLPVQVSNYFSQFNLKKNVFDLLEGSLRLIIFIGYVAFAAQMTEVKRVFMYHGAEHKVINCLENGYELTVKNVKMQSKRHKSCNVSFVLLVLLVSIILFMLLPAPILWQRILFRVLLVPLVSGISYELVRNTGKSNNFIVNVFSLPGLLLQGFTTREPDDGMIEVAIKSVEAVFDSQAFLARAEVRQNIQRNSSNASNVYPVNVNYSKNGKTANKKANVRNMPTYLDAIDDEDDEILKALDKYIS